MSIVDKILDMITGGGQQQGNPQDVRPASEDPYGDPADQGMGQQASYNRPGYSEGQVLPASQDPYGDPADTIDGHPVLDASQDPYGDPADQYNGQPVLDASQDPYGDPADQEPASRRTGGWPF